jgi:hypothetical protein
MAETAGNMPDIDSMDDKAFDALKSDMISGKDVTTPATPEAGDGLGPDTQNAPLPTDDTFPDPADGQPTGDGQQQKQESVPFGRYRARASSPQGA